jgi:heat shock protein 4
MDTDTPNGNAEPKPKTRTVRKQVRKGDLVVVSATASLDSATKNLLAERENAMQEEDKLVADTEDKKNELESYIYEQRDKIDGVYSEFASEDEKAKLKAKLDEVEVCFSPDALPLFYSGQPFFFLILQRN